MKKINLKILIITGIFCLLPTVIGLIFYNALPDNIAIHFNINNDPDNYFSKSIFVFGMPMMMLILQIFCCIVSDLSDKNPEANKKTITVYKWIIPILSMTLYFVTIMYALGNTIDIRKVVMSILGVLFIIIGNYTPKMVGNNKFVTIKNEKLNKKLIKISGYMLILNGLLFIISMLFDTIFSVILVGIAILEAIVLSIFSFLCIEHKK